MFLHRVWTRQSKILNGGETNKMLYAPVFLDQESMPSSWPQVEAVDLRLEVPLRFASFSWDLLLIHNHL